MLFMLCYANVICAILYQSLILNVLKTANAARPQADPSRPRRTSVRPLQTSVDLGEAPLDHGGPRWDPSRPRHTPPYPQTDAILSASTVKIKIKIKKCEQSFAYS